MYKVCSKCKDELPLTSKYFFKRADSSDGFRGQCKKCESKRKKRHYEENKSKILEKKSIYDAENREKVRQQNKRHYRNNRDEINSRRREHYRQNKELYSERFKDYYERNREKIIGATGEYAKENRHKTRAYEREYYKHNRDKLVQKHNRRRARRNNLKATLTNKEWKVIKEDFDYKCAYCGQERPLEREHFVPLVKGGHYTAKNIIPACRSCNASKNDSDFEGWYPDYVHYSSERNRFILEYLNN